jgi:hypothetical protein
MPGRTRSRLSGDAAGGCTPDAEATAPDHQAPARLTRWRARVRRAGMPRRSGS